MKLHTFHLIGDTSGLFPKPMLYAFTKDKSLAKDFMEMRDMSKFIYKKIEIDEADYNLYAERHSKMNLTHTKLNTKDENGELTKVPMVITFSEEEFIFLRDDSVFYELSKHTSIDALAFNDEIREALSTIYYFDVLAFFYDVDNVTYNKLKSSISSLNLIVDQFEMFLYFFGHTMK